jgi:hypothetical protein
MKEGCGSMKSHPNDLDLQRKVKKRKEKQSKEGGQAKRVLENSMRKVKS